MAKEFVTILRRDREPLMFPLTEEGYLKRKNYDSRKGGLKYQLERGGYVYTYSSMYHPVLNKKPHPRSSLTFENV